jgi:hypothetical protein
VVVDSGADLVGPGGYWLGSPSNQSDQPGYGDQTSR